MYVCKTRLTSNEIFSPSNKIHREVGRAKDLSAPLYNGYNEQFPPHLASVFRVSTAVYRIPFGDFVTLCRVTSMVTVNCNCLSEF